MVHYREFAPQREIADAVRTWPVAHRTAVRTGIAGEGEPAPQGDTAAKERIAREGRSLPVAAPPPQPAVAEAAMPSGEPVEIAAAPEAPPRAEAAPVQPPEELTIAGFDETPTAAEAAAAQQSRSRPREPAAHYPGRERGALFAGEYRGGERDTRSRDRAADRHDRSLDAVFSRLSGARDRLPDPRARARTSPGLGAVFGRLR